MIGSSVDPAMTNERYLTNLSDSAVLIENAEHVLAELNKMGIKNYIITNAVSRVAHKRLEGCSLMPYISDIFATFEIESLLEVLDIVKG